jgi:hypothetical protein
VGEECLDFRGAHVIRIAFLMKKDVAAYPNDIGFFGAVGVVFEAQNVTSLVKEFFYHSCLTFAFRSL